MIVAGSASPLLLASAAGGYNLTNSLRFRSSASAYLNRTPASAGNQKTWTWSAWIKPSRFASQQPLWNAFSSNTNYGLMSFSASGFYDSEDTFKFMTTVSNSVQCRIITNALYRDPSAWYHFVVQLDTTQATDSNRIRIYVNGVQVTSFNTATYPSQNADIAFFNTTTAQQLGTLDTGTYGYFDGYMTETHFIDGQALTPSSFGENNEDTGVWQPKKYAGTYGTNGFYLPFTDNSSLTTSSNVGLGKDFSGNGNYWTTNNISITAGVTYDSMTDVPTLTSATAANYCVLNPLDKVGSGALTGANLDYATSSGTFDPLRGTIGVSSGKWYWEVTCTATSGASPNTFTIGIASQSTNINDASWYVGKDAASYSYYGANGVKYNNNASTAYGASYTTGDVIGVALDMDAGTLVFYKNNTSQGTAFSSLVGTFMPAFSDGATSGTASVAFNFGQRPFAYTPPTGFVALNTFNLPTPTIGATASTQANKYFNATTYTGDGTNSKVITTGGGADFVWIKRRDSATSHILFDAVRGAGKTLYSHLTNAEVDNGGYYVQSFGNTGFTLGTGGDAADNANGGSYVAWSWDANGTGSSNTDGSITSTVSANTSAGFSVVTYTGTGSNATVGHGLGVAPSFIIVKARNVGTQDWQVYHPTLGINQAIQLNTTAAASSATNYWYNGVTSTVFGVNGSYAGVNGNGNTYVAYCFSEVAGYSKFGSYIGNGSTDGPFVFTGFRPRYVMIKNATNGSDGYWWIHDTARDTYNLADKYLVANGADAEGTSSAFAIDILSNGFKVRGSNNGVNGNGTTLIYMAFCESPFKYSLGR